MPRTPCVSFTTSNLPALFSCKVEGQFCRYKVNFIAANQLPVSASDKVKLTLKIVCLHFEILCFLPQTCTLRQQNKAAETLHLNPSLAYLTCVFSPIFFSDFVITPNFTNLWIYSLRLKQNTVTTIRRAVNKFRLMQHWSVHLLAVKGLMWPRQQNLVLHVLKSYQVQARVSELTHICALYVLHWRQRRRSATTVILLCPAAFSFSLP